MVQFIYALGHATNTASTCTSTTLQRTPQNKIEGNEVIHEVMEKVTGSRGRVWVGSTKKELNGPNDSPCDNVRSDKSLGLKCDIQMPA
jgi:hypothetical protein